MLYRNNYPGIISNLVLYPRSGLGGKIFVLGLIRINQESMDSRFLQRQGKWTKYTLHTADGLEDTLFQEKWYNTKRILMELAEKLNINTRKS